MKSYYTFGLLVTLVVLVVQAQGLNHTCGKVIPPDDCLPTPVGLSIQFLHYETDVNDTNKPCNDAVCTCFTQCAFCTSALDTSTTTVTGSDQQQTVTQQCPSDAPFPIVPSSLSSPLWKTADGLFKCCSTPSATPLQSPPSNFDFAFMVNDTEISAIDYVSLDVPMTNSSTDVFTDTPNQTATTDSAFDGATTDIIPAEIASIVTDDPNVDASTQTSINYSPTVTPTVISTKDNEVDRGLSASEIAVNSANVRKRTKSDHSCNTETTTTTNTITDTMATTANKVSPIHFRTDNTDKCHDESVRTEKRHRKRIASRVPKHYH